MLQGSLILCHFHGLINTFQLSTWIKVSAYYLLQFQCPLPLALVHLAVSIHVISAQPAAYVSQQRSNSLDLTGGLSDVLLGLTVVASRCGAEIEKYFIINDQNSQAR